VGADNDINHNNNDKDNNNNTDNEDYKDNDNNEDGGRRDGSDGVQADSGGGDGLRVYGY
jgi:hypothetical protein